MFENLKFNLKEWALLEEKDILRWRGLCLPATVTDCEGNEKETNTYDLMISWYSLAVHTGVNEVMELPYLINEIVDCEVYDDKTLKQPIDAFLKRFMPNNQHPLTSDLIKRLIFVWQSRLHNFLVATTETYAVSATAESIVELLDHEWIVDLRKRIANGKTTIDDGEVEFSEWIKTDDSISHNVFVMLSRTGGVSINQGYQTIVVRGATFDINNRINPNNVLSNYSEGIVNLADSLGDSRGSGKALLSNGAGLQNSEWFHRKGRLYAGVVKGIQADYDCGSDILVPLKVRSYDSLMAIQGMWGTLNPKDEVELLTVERLKDIPVQSTVYVRNPAFCKNHDATTPCQKCFGGISTAVPYNVLTGRYANLGSWSATTIIKDIGQGMLSIKHFLRNTTTVPYKTSPLDKDVISSNGDNIFLTEELLPESPELILNSKIIKELSDLRSLDSLENISTDKLSYFTEITLKYTVEDPMVGGKTNIQRPVNVSVSNRKAIMTPEMLSYVIKHGWTQPNKNFIHIDMSKWDYRNPMLTLTVTHEDLNYIRKEVEDFLKHAGRNKQWLAKEVTPEFFGETLMSLWELINSKFKGINMCYSSILLYATTARDPFNGNYEVMNGNAPKYFVSYESCLYNRGVGTSFLFSNPQRNINNPEWFLIKNRQNGIYESYWQHVIA